jgi:two-component system chemotaxis response regulator CheB
MISEILSRAPGIRVVGTASDGREAVSKALLLEPHVLTLDVMMPRLDGLHALQLLASLGSPSVLMLSHFTKEGAELTLRALELGALDFVDKGSPGLAQELPQKVRALAGKKPPRRPPGRCPVKELPRGSGRIKAVAVGASTGGPQALQILLPAFPPDVRFGLLVAQHMPRGFTAPFAQRLQEMCRLQVREARHGDKLHDALVLVAPAGMNMTLEKDLTVRLQRHPQSPYRPSIDVLFASAAEALGSRAMGVLLTGMGADGLKGAQALKARGAPVLAQDEETSVVFGMPKVAQKAGVVDKMVSIIDMAEAIASLA